MSPFPSPILYFPILEQTYWSIEIVRLPYGIEHALALARAVEMPQYAEYAFELQRADHRSQMHGISAIPASILSSV